MEHPPTHMCSARRRRRWGSDWVQLEAATFRFRDPLNQQRRFIPLRLDAARIKGSAFLCVNGKTA